MSDPVFPATGTPDPSGNSQLPAAPIPHILVVDENLDMHFLLGELLGAEGFSVGSALGQADAVMALTARPTSLVICEIPADAPDDDQFWRRIRGLPGYEQVPLLLTSLDPVPSQYYPQRLALFMRKPFDLDVLLQAVRQLIAAGEVGQD